MSSSRDLGKGVTPINKNSDVIGGRGSRLLTFRNSFVAEITVAALGRPSLVLGRKRETRGKSGTVLAWHTAFEGGEPLVILWGCKRETTRQASELVKVMSEGSCLESKPLGEPEGRGGAQKIKTVTQVKKRNETFPL